MLAPAYRSNSEENRAFTRLEAYLLPTSLGKLLTPTWEHSRSIHRHTWQGQGLLSVRRIRLHNEWLSITLQNIQRGPSFLWVWSILSCRSVAVAKCKT